MRRTQSMLVAVTLAFLVAASEASAGSVLFASSAEASAAGARPVHRTGGSEGGADGITLLRIHGGFSLPTGDFGDAFDAGLGFGVNVAHGVSRTVLLSGGVGFHTFDGDGFGGDATIVPITFNADCLFPGSGKIHPWIGGGVGFYNVEIDTGPILIPGFGIVSGSADETNFGLNFGGGIASRSGSKGVWGVGLRFHHVFEGDTFESLDFMQLHAGYGFFL